ncbi:SUMF1/EgtB/PvdO family nonheme iron enzyme [bacterium]|nr:SUMF1/EgtB/PvdO family nonheme iron enzyme [bacterium]
MTAGRNNSKMILGLGIVCLVAAAAIYFGSFHTTSAAPSLAIPAESEENASLPPEVKIPGGAYLIGKDAGPRNAQPMRQIQLKPFAIDRTEVTNGMFAQFVAATSYQTDAERRGYSLCFDQHDKKFVEKQGANWKQPGGPGSSIVGRDNHPVVHVSWYDASAYAKWSGKHLPTEFQWEAAARGKQLQNDFPWPQDDAIPVSERANLWQGNFPLNDRGLDGSQEPAPVGSFPPGTNGLSDLAGNVAEWTSSWYAEDSYDRIDENNPSGPASGEKKVVRGGSWISSDQTGTSEAMVWYRAKLSPELSNNFTGFRCVSEPE